MPKILSESPITIFSPESSLEMSKEGRGEVMKMIRNSVSDKNLELPNWVIVAEVQIEFKRGEGGEWIFSMNDYLNFS